MRRPSRTGLLWMFVCFTNLSLTAQNLETIGRENPLSLNGGLSISQVLYTSNGVMSRRDPYSYFASGNVSLSLYGWTMPFVFNVSNQTTSYSQPFNRFVIHPTWKWVTLHAGYSSMSFSPYTVNGHIFSGTAVELTPGRWKVAALYGRFLKASSSDPTSNAHVAPSYQRLGYGLKAGYRFGGHSIDLILFHANDQTNSIQAPADSLLIMPQENLVVSAALSTTLLKRFVVKTEVASSALTRDIRTDEADHRHWLARSDILFTPRLSSTFYHAVKASIDHQYKGSLIGIGYERIDPEYRTLGAYYFNNDLENITLNGSATLADGKLNVAASAGFQNDNVDKSRISTMRRIVTSLNAGYTPSQKLNFAASWSTFQTYTNVRSQFENINQITPYDNLDTLDFTQISRNASLSGMVLLPGRETRRQNLTLNLSWQDASDRQGNEPAHAGTRFYNLSTGYTVAVTPKNLTLFLLFNTAINESAIINTRMMGPSASVTRSLLNRRLRATLSGSWTQSYNQGVMANAVWNGRFNTALSISGRHNLNASAVFIKRRMAEALSKRITELTATIGYQYSFGVRGKPGRNKKAEKTDP